MITKSDFMNNTPDWADGPLGYYERDFSFWSIAKACTAGADWKWCH
jgi:hypothetical protein